MIRKTGKNALDLKAPIETEQSSSYDDSKPFREQVEYFLEGKIPERDTLLISGTPEVLQKIGFSNLPLTIDQKHMRDVLGKPKNADHDLGVDFMKHLDEYVAHPIAIIENSGDLDGGVIMIFSEKNKNANDKPIIGMMNIRNKGKFNIAETDANRLMTIHSRGDWMKRLQEAIQKEQNGQVGIYYINKKEARALLGAGQSQVLRVPVQDGFNQSITEEALPVNMKRMGWHDDFELNGFRGGEREAGGTALFLRKKETPTESALTVRASNLLSDGRVQFPAISEQAVLTLSIFDAGGDVKNLAGLKR